MSYLAHTFYNNVEYELPYFVLSGRTVPFKYVQLAASCTVIGYISSAAR